MPRRTSEPKEELPPPNLLENREVACRKIQSQIEKGQQCRDRSINSEKDLEEARAERLKWSNYNLELLGRIFDNSARASEYKKYDRGESISLINPSLQEEIEPFRRRVTDNITCLESIRDRLELIPELPSAPPPAGANLATPSRDVFVVHGHDEGAKQAVARLVENLGLKAVILHEQSNAGRTIIEKFEDCSDVGFAVVLLTPDDVGAPHDKETKTTPRARQNVIFELGYFMGKIGRKRVLALYKEGVELPSDMHGVLYVPMDDGGTWHFRLAKEMKAAGLPIDMNDV